VQLCPSRKILENSTKYVEKGYCKSSSDKAI